MTLKEYYEQYAKVMLLCHEYIHIHPEECIKCNGTPLIDLQFSFDESDDYTFARAIIEDRAVFAGDVLYWTTNKHSITVDEFMNLDSEFLTWTDPKIIEDPYLEFKTAFADGRRIVWKDRNNRWHDAEKDEQGNFFPLGYVLPLDCYKIIPYDTKESALYYTPISDEAVRLQFTRSQIDNSLTVEILK